MKTLLKKHYGVVLIVLLVTAAFAPLISGGIISIAGDTLEGNYAYFAFLQNSLRSEFTLPLWSSGILGGFPIYADVNAGFFYPVYWLIAFLFKDPITVFNIVLYLNFLLTALFTFLFLRDLKLKSLPSVFGAVTYLFSFFVLAQHNHIMFTVSFFVLPALLWSLGRAQRNSWYYLVSTLFLGIAWLAGFPELNVYLITVGFFYLLFLEWQKQAKWKALGFSVIKFAGINLGAILIGWPQFKGNFLLLQLSERKIGFSALEIFQSGGFNFPIPDDFLRFILPTFKVHFLSGHNLFFGFISLLLLIISFTFLKKHRTLLFFFVLMVLTFLASLRFSPLLYLIQSLPVFDLFHHPHRRFFIVLFSAAVLSSMALHHLPLFKPKKWLNLRTLNILSLLFVVSILVLNIAFAFWFDEILLRFQSFYENTFYSPELAQTLEHYHSEMARLFYQAKDSIWLGNASVLTTMLVFIAAIILFNLYFKKKIRLVHFSVLAILLTVIHGSTLAYFELPFVGRADLDRTPQAIEFIREYEEQTGSTEPFRVHPFLVQGFVGDQRFTDVFLDEQWNYDQFAQFEWYRESVRPNVNLLHSIDFIDGYSQFTPTRQMEILEKLVSTADSKQRSAEENVDLFLKNMNLLSILNIKYLVSAIPLEAPQIEELTVLEVTDYKFPLYIYQVNNVYPRVYFPEFARKIRTDSTQILPKLVNYNASERYALIEHDTEIPPFFTNASTSVQIDSYKDGEVLLTVSTSKDQFLVLQEGNAPGWVATVDGEEVRIYKTNYIFQGIIVPAGEHQVQWKYKGLSRKNIQNY